MKIFGNVWITKNKNIFYGYCMIDLKNCINNIKIKYVRIILWIKHTIIILLIKTCQNNYNIIGSTDLESHWLSINNCLIIVILLK